MRQRALFALIAFGGVLLLLVRFAPSTPVKAAALLQDIPRLDGYQIYLAESNGEPSRFDRSTEGISRFAGLLQRLGAQLNTVEWNKDIPAEVDLVVLVGPVNDLDAEQSARLWSYVRNNGRLLLVADPLRVNTRDGVQEYQLANSLQADEGFMILTWDDLGIRAREDVVVMQGDLQTIIPPADDVDDNQPTPTPLPAVEVPVLSRDFTTTELSSEHPITEGLTDRVAFFGARSIEFDASIQLFETLPLIFASSEMYGETAYDDYLETGISEYNINEDTARGPLAVAASVEDPATGTRIVLIGDRDFVTNGGGLQTSPSYSAGFVYPGNVRFLLNAIAWLLEADPSATVELTFPTPAATATPTTTPSPVPTATPEPEETTEPEETSGDEGS